MVIHKLRCQPRGGGFVSDVMLFSNNDVTLESEGVKTAKKCFRELLTAQAEDVRCETILN